ncbi:hypothetical protein C0J52_17429 [Blattella germanica]|nr:hypothetical protein C0J52_17429 [Blattella germanica]
MGFPDLTSQLPALLKLRGLKEVSSVFRKQAQKIKPGGPGIGRKVKVKNPVILPPNRRERDPPATAAAPTAVVSPLKYNYPPKPSNNGYVSSVNHGILNGHVPPSLAHTKPQGNNHAQKPGNPDIMKRPLSHKPQNLTPPGSSDGGSSGSGQSPTSTHPGSPPSTISSSTMKRPGYIDGADGLPTKRQRISHYRKPTEIVNTTARLPDSSQQQRSILADSSSQPDDFYQRNNRDRRDAIKTNPRIREFSGSRGNGGGSGGGGGGGNDALSRNGYGGHHYDNSVVSSAMNGRCISGPENEENDDKRCGTSAQGGYDNSVVANKARCESVASNTSGGRSACSGTNVTSASMDDSSSAWNRSTENGNGVLSQSSSRGPGGHHDNRNSRWSNRVSSTTQKGTASGSSPDSQLENMDTGDDKESKEKTSASSSTEYPEYLLNYSSIRDSAQRKRYKADFTADYKEYRDLHAEVESVSKRFAQLEERLRQEEKNSPGWRDIKNQIVREYQENKRDLRFQEHKRRFQYLHEKLSHIKRLVLEYDSAVSSGGDHY